MMTFETLTTLYEPVEAPLRLVQERVDASWREVLALCNVSVDETSGMGGKMLRPAMCLLSAGALGAPDLNRFVPMAASLELVHLASLAHDDVIDQALLRRGGASLNALWDDHAAVLAGDYLVSRAIEGLIPYNHCHLLSDVITAIRTMAEGELRYFGQRTETIRYDDCIALAARKTASLFQYACGTPARLMDSPLRKPLMEYGHGVGIAFQIVDDLLDLTRSEAELGKPACADMAEGKITAPIFFLFEMAAPEDAERLRQMHGKPVSEADRCWIARLMQESGATERGVQTAHGYIDEAKRALEALPDNDYCDRLRDLADFMLLRLH